MRRTLTMEIGKNECSVERTDSSFMALRRTGELLPDVRDAAHVYCYYPSDMFGREWIRLRDNPHMWPTKRVDAGP